VPHEGADGLALEGVMIDGRLELPGWSVDAHGFLWKRAIDESR
jgi:hypothetical protein